MKQEKSAASWRSRIQKLQDAIAIQKAELAQSTDWASLEGDAETPSHISSKVTTTFSRSRTVSSRPLERKLSTESITSPHLQLWNGRSRTRTASDAFSSSLAAGPRRGSAINEIKCSLWIWRKAGAGYLGRRRHPVICRKGRNQLVSRWFKKAFG